MSHSYRRWAVTTAVAVAAAVAIVGCLILAEPGPAPTRVAAADISPAAAHGSGATVAPAATSILDPTPDPPTTVVHPAQASARGVGGAAVPSTVAPLPRPASTPSTQPSATVAPPTPSHPTPPAPGTYRYRQVGTLPGTPTEGTLVVAPASASGTQVWTRVVGGTLTASTSTMLFTARGSYLVSPGSQAAGASSCSFAAPVPWPPWPTTPGQSVSAHASCTGGISSFQVTGQAQGTVQVVAAGHAIAAAVVVYTLALNGTVSGSPLNVTYTETDYYAPGLSVPVVTRTHVSGSAVGLPITTDRTDTLESLTPA